MAAIFVDWSVVPKFAVPLVRAFERSAVDMDINLVSPIADAMAQTETSISNGQVLGFLAPQARGLARLASLRPQAD